MLHMILKWARSLWSFSHYWWAILLSISYEFSHLCRFSIKIMASDTYHIFGTFCIVSRAFRYFKLVLCFDFITFTFFILRDPQFVIAFKQTFFLFAKSELWTLFSFLVTFILLIRWTLYFWMILTKGNIFFSWRESELFSNWYLTAW